MWGWAGCCCLPTSGIHHNVWWGGAPLRRKHQELGLAPSIWKFSLELCLDWAGSWSAMKSCPASWNSTIKGGHSPGLLPARLWEIWSHETPVGQILCMWNINDPICLLGALQEQQQGTSETATPEFTAEKLSVNDELLDAAAGFSLGIPKAAESCVLAGRSGAGGQGKLLPQHSLISWWFSDVGGLHKAPAWLLWWRDGTACHQEALSGLRLSGGLLRLG